VLYRRGYDVAMAESDGGGNPTDCHSMMVAWQVLCCGLCWSGSVDGFCNCYSVVHSEKVRGKELGHVT